MILEGRGATPPRDPAPALRVLVVDDNRDAADTTALLLTLTGSDSRACYDGPAALREAEHFAPAVCLIDLNMPGMDGDEVAVRLAVVFAGRRVLLVALTAMSDDGARRRIEAAGFHRHLVKPVAPEELIAVVDAERRAAAASLPQRLDGD